jgi:uncharacterized membrane protein (UPF0136 family)
MNADPHVARAYSGLVAVGGVIGWIKAGSAASLVAVSGASFVTHGYKLVTATCTDALHAHRALDQVNRQGTELLMCIHLLKYTFHYIFRRRYGLWSTE